MASNQEFERAVAAQARAATITGDITEQEESERDSPRRHHPMTSAATAEPETAAAAAPAEEEAVGQPMDDAPEFDMEAGLIVAEDKSDRCQSLKYAAVLAGVSLIGAIVLIVIYVSANKTPTQMPNVVDIPEPQGTTTSAVPPPAKKRAPPNVIFMVSDGMGPSAVTAARLFVDKTHTTEFDELLTGTSMTYAANHLVTDSAAGATAWSCGLKTDNGFTGVDPTGAPCGTLLEGAKLQGMSTGIIVTSEVSHATPAAFTSHAKDRWSMALVADQQVMQDMDVILGGGRCYFQPRTTQLSCRTDSRDLIAEQVKAGYTYVSDRNQLLASKTSPILGLFTPAAMSYDLDRNATLEPSLAEMTSKGLSLLQDLNKPFFVVVEGSRIDHAAHSNDIAGVVHEVLAYQEAVKVAVQFAATHANTLVISLSDHETGGLSVSEKDSYDWKTERVRAAIHTTEYLAVELLGIKPVPSKDQIAAKMMQYFGLARSEISSADLTTISNLLLTATGPKGTLFPLGAALSKSLSAASLTGWTSGGHTGVDVNLYAYGPADLVAQFHAVQDNTAVGHKLAAMLDIDFTAVTEYVQEKFGTSTGPGVRSEPDYPHHA